MKISEKCTVSRRLRCKVPHFEGEGTDALNAFCEKLCLEAAKYTASGSFPEGGVYFIDYELRGKEVLEVIFQLSLRFPDGRRLSKELVTLWKRGMLHKMKVSDYLSR